jgi:hypothetical protein
MTQGKSKTGKIEAGAPRPDPRLSRDEACAALSITPEFLDRLERSGALSADAHGRLDPLAVAAAAARYGLAQAEAADIKLSEVGAALTEVKPALERLAGLADRAELSGDPHTRVMIEVAAFFNAFAAVMNRATAALKADEEEA